jgi:hypothetical protein
MSRSSSVLNRHVAIACMILFTFIATTAHADSLAVVKTTRSGTSSVRVDGKRVWRADGSGVKVVSSLVWSRRDDALAFATCNQSGRVALIVVLIGGDTHGHVMRWPIPAGALSCRGGASIAWLGPRRVAVGPSLLVPSVVASWRVRAAR